MQITRDNLIFLAAMIDGEGTIGIEKQSPNGKGRKKTYYTVRLVIVNTSMNLMNWLKENIPVGLFSKRKKIEGRKFCYVWRVFGKNAEDILEQIKPFIVIKRNQVDCVLRFRKTVGKTGWNVTDEVLSEREFLYQECKKYNVVGE